MSTVTLHIGDVFDELARLEDGSVDQFVTSSPFLALRSYLPADHPDKHREIGSEATPAAYLDTLLALTAEWRRVLAPHGSICVELGDTYSGSGGAGGDYGPDGLRDGQAKFDGTARRAARLGEQARPGPGLAPRDHPYGWPLAKSLTGIPTLYTWSLAYGRNLLTDAPSPAGPWRIRNLLVWARPNPPVGALGDKFRPATSYITVACTGSRRWFDLDAVREQNHPERADRTDSGGRPNMITGIGNQSAGSNGSNLHPAGAPPLDWHTDLDDGPTGDRLWQMPTQPYSGAHYATFPLELPRRLIDAMCPRQVCRTCGKPRERIAAPNYVPDNSGGTKRMRRDATEPDGNNRGINGDAPRLAVAHQTLGWSDCGHDNYRPGIVCDPFLGSGTTAVAAAQLGRDCVGIDLDQRNTGLVDMRLRERLHIIATSYQADREATAEHPVPEGSGWHRLGPYGKTTVGARGVTGGTVRYGTASTVVWECDPPLPDQRNQLEGQTNLFDHLPLEPVDIDTKERL